MHPNQGKNGEEPYWVETQGRYVDRFERRDGVWKLIERTATIDLSRQTPVPPAFNRAYTFEGAALYPDDIVYRHKAAAR
jgi:hypothetical protein